MSDSVSGGRGVIISPGAIGDCVVTLPLAKFMRDRLGLGAVDMIARSEYANIYRDRSCISTVRSMDMIDLHRLFTAQNNFEVEEHDQLVSLFSRYNWIVSLLGEPGSDFEANLIYTVYCSRGADVCVLPFKASADFCGHISQFYIDEFVRAGDLGGTTAIDGKAVLLGSKEGDVEAGRELAGRDGVDANRELVLIHPGSGGSHKCWHIDNFLRLAGDLRADGREIVFLLGPAELERYDEGQVARIKRAGACICPASLDDVALLLANTNCYVGNDSGITHIAATMGIGTLAIFGVTDPVLYRPIGPKVRVLDIKAEFFASDVSDSAGEAVEMVLELLND